MVITQLRIRPMSLLETLQKKPLIGDGAMGTMLYANGVFINTCYEQLCLTQPNLIERIHRDYVQAGADLIETNTFGANRLKLETHGIADQLEAINRTAVHLARNVAGPTTYILGSVGPLLQSDQLFSDRHTSELEHLFHEQIALLADENVDAIQLETFTHVDEAELGEEYEEERGSNSDGDQHYSDMHPEQWTNEDGEAFKYDYDREVQSNQNAVKVVNYYFYMFQTSFLTLAISQFLTQ